MGRKALLALLVVATLVAGVATLATASHGGFHASLDGYQEVPTLSTPGQGSFTATLVDGGTALRYTLTYSDLEGTAEAAHIHLGRPAVNGGVVAFLCNGGGVPNCPPGGGTVKGEIDASDVTGGAASQGIAAGEFDELVAAMEANATYVNVHTSTRPGGEIRGEVKSD